MRGYIEKHEGQCLGRQVEGLCVQGVYGVGFLSAF